MDNQYLPEKFLFHILSVTLVFTRSFANIKTGRVNKHMPAPYCCLKYLRSTRLECRQTFQLFPNTSTLSPTTAVVSNHMVRNRLQSWDDFQSDTIHQFLSYKTKRPKCHVTVHCQSITDVQASSTNLIQETIFMQDSRSHTSLTNLFKFQHILNN